MTKEELILLKKDIRELKMADFEARLQMYGEYIFLLINSLLFKGINSEVTKDLIRIKNEYMNIFYEESFLLSLIRKNAINKNLNAVDILMGKLNELMERTVDYYYELIDDIEDEIHDDRGYPYRRRKKDFDTLIETYDYRKEVVGLDVSLEDVKTYLGYEEEFFLFIKPFITVISNPYEDYDDKMDFYGVWYDFNQDNELCKLRICIPEIVDIKTAQIVLHEYKHAHDIYVNLRSRENIVVSKSEEEARALEAPFKDEYIVKKYKNYFK